MLRTRSEATSASDSVPSTATTKRPAPSGRGTPPEPSAAAASRRVNDATACGKGSARSAAAGAMTWTPTSCATQGHGARAAGQGRCLCGGGRMGKQALLPVWGLARSKDVAGRPSRSTLSGVSTPADTSIDTDGHPERASRNLYKGSGNGTTSGGPAVLPRDCWEAILTRLNNC